MAESKTSRRAEKTRLFLIILFCTIFCAMLFVTVRAAITRSVLDNGHLMQDVWFQATLADAYFGFITFFVWVAWKERSLARQIVWFVLIMLLGNLAMAVYVLIQLFRSRADTTIQDVLLRPPRKS